MLALMDIPVLALVLPSLTKPLRGDGCAASVRSASFLKSLNSYLLQHFKIKNYSRFYLFPDFLKDKPIERLFDRELKAEWFNDDALGRCLDKIAQYGVTKLFTEISFHIGHSRNLLGRSINIDTTLYGSYESNEESFSEVNPIPRPMQGYSKSGQHDLKQMILLLATTGTSHFAIWMKRTVVMRVTKRP